MKKSQKGTKKAHGISITTTILFLTLILLVVMGITRFNDVRAQTNRLKAESVELNKEKKALQEELDQIHKEANNNDSKAYVESVARTHLDMVYPDEIIFHVSDD